MRSDLRTLKLFCSFLPGHHRRSNALLPSLRLLRCKHRQHTAEEYLEQYRIVYSVSYTHLDVYKRQVLIQTLDVAGKFCNAALHLFKLLGCRRQLPLAAHFILLDKQLHEPGFVLLCIGCLLYTSASSRRPHKSRHGTQGRGCHRFP